jgi:hypothetical protein
MLKAAQQRLDADKAWLSEQRGKLTRADAALDKAFATLLPAEKAQ